nr:phage holin family protein [uncultured Butyricicoccus sp.]
MQKRCDRMAVHLTNAKAALLSGAAVVGGVLSELFGGWDAAMATLLMFMATDYITGLVVAGVFQNSDKTESGSLSSTAGWRGLCKKGMTLVVVLVAARLDIVLGTSFVRDAVVIAYLANETISIIENAGLMGLPVPDVIMQAIEQLQGKKSE